MKQTPESFKTYAAILNGVAKGTDVLVDVLLKAHDAVASLPMLVDDVTVHIEDSIEKAIVVVSEYGDALEAKVDEVSKEVFPETVSEPPVKNVQDTKPEKPTADMSREEKMAYITKEYGLSNTEEQQQALNLSSDGALTQAVEVIKVRKALK